MGDRNFNNIFEIIKKDFKSALSNPIVTIVLIGLIILPSLYALLNIQACWDPYGNTGDVTFAIANLDEGATFEGTTMNVGNELVKDLKNNDKFNWTFVTEDELRDGVYKGEYYAGIVIPKNLSKNIISIAGDNPQQAKLEYIVNMKQNPVAAKLTDTGSTAVYTALNAKIIEIINLAAYGKLGELQEGLSSGASQLASGGSQLQAGSAQISSGASQVSSGVGDVKDGASQVQNGAQEVNNGVSSVQQGSIKIQNGAQEVNNGASSVQQGSAQVKSGANQVQQGSEELESAVDPSLIPDGPVKEYVSGNAKLASGTSQVANGASRLADGSVQLAEGSSNLANGSSQLADGSVQLAEGSLALAAGSELLSNAATQALFTAAASLASSADSLASITGINETMLGDYFYSPVKLDRHELFSVPDYGSQVSPFYLVLSMWVGALITCAMLKPGTSEGTKYSSLEMYAGKAVIFLVMSLLQVTVTIIGAHILGIYIENEILFALSCYLVSAVFMVLVYSLVSALGDVGKAVAIVLLVIQISGTGGIYPVEIMAQFFRVLNPYLPMTYAITLIREAQLGLIWSNYLPALIILLGIGLATVIVMMIIKEKADKATHYFEERLEDSGLF
ncbi:YhgE/Pip domain-containing protein [Methanobrevibacter sp.]|uniref:YhgE/Pip domain-containing protein n=1 Tax=Methanobrevibacter sp. TaxID=66852 RepID=UPI0026E0632C|nr:YhgE/Pip domain-containing protein [Methanobrevibacter sp.]MDO5859924.1 YhgE/Pip domain-containing protein [Methanobrevibacter sp.]